MNTPVFGIRGIRNHNPGNIRHGEKWEGLASEQPDASFCCFTSPEFGIRAMARILINYQRRHGLNTVRGIINRWAPPSENDTGAYVDHVAMALGVAPDDDIQVQDHLDQLLAVIIEHENGINPYSDALILHGIALAVS